MPSTDPAAPVASTLAPEDLGRRYREVRRATEALAEPLEVEDTVVQSMPDASPVRWHLAHTTWFFETFVLAADPGYRPFDPAYRSLFNSYYDAVGEPFPRPERGLLTRPTLEEVGRYRRHVDEHVARSLERGLLARRLLPVVELGLHHEQQHQELILTDVKHLLSLNPLAPVYRERAPEPPREAPPLRWLGFPEGLRWVGHDGRGFAFDNESPRHRELVPAFELASRCVTNAEFAAFVEDGGYERPALWLSEGWQRVRAEGWSAPLYWRRRADGFDEFTLAGVRPLDPSEPVGHVSLFEADAFARWKGARLPTEAEWETAAEGVPVEGNFASRGRHHPQAASGDGAGPSQMYGDVWEWTSSPYVAYPGYRAPEGALGEYNGKFMCNQHVLRGGSAATPAGHVRRTYRNFFPPHARWQFSGIRLAR
jgi:ergothioneine biosynthesis protein EgtB